VGELHAQNSNYKHYEQIFKDKLLEEKLKCNMTLNLKPTNVILIVNYAWQQSFAGFVNNTKAILEQGWAPLLEVHPDVLRTKKGSDDSNVLYISAQTNSLSTITCDLAATKTNMGAAAVLLEAAINSQKIIQRQ
jgi:hypothetical protein